MIFLAAAGNVKMYEEELGMKCGQLLYPKSSQLDADVLFGIDNGCFTRFDEQRFFALLRRDFTHKARCRFVALPDVVGCVDRTYALYEHYFNRPIFQGWPLGYVCQDGQNPSSIPWSQIKAIFIGGSTEWKNGLGALACIREAQNRQLWVHVGRVNTSYRIEKFQEIGVDSFDGTGLTRFRYERKHVAGQLSYPKLDLV